MQIPGVGIRTAADYQMLNITKISDLANCNPNELYERLCVVKGVRIDRCELYQLRCSVYFASTDEPEPELLRWWNWKNRKYSTEE